LAKLRDSRDYQNSVALAWKTLFGHLRHRLRYIVWSRVVEDARQAADLLWLLHPRFYQHVVRALTIGSFKEMRRAANLAARVLFLLPLEKQQALSSNLALREVVFDNIARKNEAESLVQVKLASDIREKQVLPIPIIRIKPTTTMLLLVNQEQYGLDIRVDPGASLSTRMHFIVNTSDLPVRPGLHKIFDVDHMSRSQTLGFQVTPDDAHAFPDRLTVQMFINGRGQRLMAYEIFVCDRYVLRGLRL
jgi:hypothetical protein